MKIFLLVLMLVISPFGLASYHEASGGGGGANPSGNSGGYGGGGGAIVGVLLVVGLVYFFTRDSYDEEEVKSELLAQKSSEPKRFEFNFKHENPNEDFNSYNSNGFEIPQNSLQLNFKYNLN